MSVSQCSTNAADAVDKNGRRLTTTPRLTLRCPSGYVIHISRSYHGARRSMVEAAVDPFDHCPPIGAGNTIGNGGGGGGVRCSYCDGDCVDESIGVVYDWSSSSCTGRETCSRAVLQSHMPHCPPLPPTSVGGVAGGLGRVQSSGAPKTSTADARRAPVVVRPASSSASLSINGLSQLPNASDRFSDYLQVDYDCVDR
jgi:hypothetical protein